MRRLLMMSVVAGLLGGCGLVQVPTTASLQPGDLGTGFDPDVTSVNLAQWAFADPGRTAGRPAEAARAAAAMDYAAGALNTSPRWANIAALTKVQLLQGRSELRQALYVAPGAPSQAVVDHLLATSRALAAGDRQAALNDLSGPPFAAPPQRVLAQLDHMPYLQMANVSTMHAANELFGPGDDNDWR